ncbi:MAG: Enoyl-CoA hydratase, partial [uncultured Frankineae bacterium]
GPHLLRRRDPRQGRPPAPVPSGRAQHDDPGLLARAARDRHGDQRRGQCPGRRDQQHRPALQRGHGPVGLRRHGRAGRRAGAAARAYPVLRPRAAVVVHRAGEGPRAGARRRPGRGDRGGRRPRHGLRPALRQRGRLLLRAGDQHRDDRGRRHPAATRQDRSRGVRPGDGLHRASGGRATGVRGGAGAGGLRRPRGTGRRRARHGPRDRGALAAGGLGHEGGDELRARPPRRRRPGADRDLAGRHVPAGRHGRGLHGQGREAAPGLPRPAPRAEGPV